METLKFHLCYTQTNAKDNNEKKSIKPLICQLLIFGYLIIQQLLQIGEFSNYLKSPIVLSTICNCFLNIFKVSGMFSAEL